MQMMSNRLFGKDCHATKTPEGWVVYIYVDKVYGIAQKVSDPVSLEVAKEIMREIQGNDNG